MGGERGTEAWVGVSEGRGEVVGVVGKTVAGGPHEAEDRHSLPLPRSIGRQKEGFPEPPAFLPASIALDCTRAKRRELCYASIDFGLPCRKKGFEGGEARQAKYPSLNSMLPPPSSTPLSPSQIL